MPRQRYKTLYNSRQPMLLPQPSQSRHMADGTYHNHQVCTPLLLILPLRLHAALVWIGALLYCDANQPLIAAVQVGRALRAIMLVLGVLLLYVLPHIWWWHPFLNPANRLLGGPKPESNLADIQLAAIFFRRQLISVDCQAPFDRQSCSVVSHVVGPFWSWADQRVGRLSCCLFQCDTALHCKNAPSCFIISATTSDVASTCSLCSRVGARCFGY